MKIIYSLFAFLFITVASFAGDRYDKIDGIYYKLHRKYANSRFGIAIVYDVYQYSYGAYTGDVVIPEYVEWDNTTFSVKGIGSYAFYDCIGLTSVSILASVEDIGERAFDGCTGLTSVTIPSSVTSIGNNAFNGCKSIKSIYSYTKSPTSSVGSKFFSSNYTDATLYVPKGTKALYQETEGWKKFQNIVEFDAAAVNEIIGTDETEAKIINTYSIDGKRLSQSQKGLNIIKMSDGTTKKVVK